MFQGLKNKMFGRFGKDIGIDLGTSNTIIFVKNKGIVVQEPSVVAINSKTEQILAIGHEAKNMLGKTPPYIQVSKPLVGGIISDYEVAEKMIKFFLDKINEDNLGFWARPRVVVCCPLEITEVEIKAIEDACLSAGARQVNIVQEPMAAAIGGRMPIRDPLGNMVINIGGGKSEMAVISLGGVVVWKSTTVAGEEMNKNIVQYAREAFNLLIGETYAEQIKIKIGSALAFSEKTEFPIRGRDMISGLPKEVIVSDSHIREALERSVKTIVEQLKTILEITPPELTADIHERGILLTGGGSVLKGLDKILSQSVEIPVRLSDDPLTAAVRGIGLLLDDDALLREISLPSARDYK